MQTENEKQEGKWTSHRTVLVTQRMAGGTLVDRRGAESRSRGSVLDADEANAPARTCEVWLTVH